MSRCRESSGLSSGSQIVPPGESSCGKDCASRTRFSKSVVRRLAALEPVADERAAVDGAEDHVLAADVHAPLGVARLQVELARRLRHLLEDPVGVELDELPLDRPGPPWRKSSCASSCWKSTPSSQTIRRQPRSSSCHRGLVEDLVPRQFVDQHVAPPGVVVRGHASSPLSPVSRTSSGRPSFAAARSALARSSSVGDWASQTTRL